MPNIILYDCETRSSMSVKEFGIDNHADPEHTEVTLVAFKVWGEEGRADYWRPKTQPVPESLCDPDNLYVAANSRYDRIIHDRVLRASFPELPQTDVASWYDFQVVARSNGWPSGLDACLRLARLPTKRTSVAVKRTFSKAYLLTDDDPVWTQLIDYCRYDVESMEKLLDRDEMVMPNQMVWDQFHAFERINDRGLPIDMDLLRQITHHLEPVTARFIDEFVDLTGLRPTQTVKLNKWVYDELPIDLRPLVLNAAGKISLDKRDNLPAVLDALRTPPHVRKALTILTEARKSSLAKFKSLTNLAHQGRVKGAYVFNGAPATGRFSSKGAQVHNFPKKAVAIEQLAALKTDNTEDLFDLIPWREVPAVASKALRPLVHYPDHEIIWVDWSAIEACILPWLTLDPRCDERLAILRDAGDIYMKTVFDVWGVMDRAFRQAGKAMELGLGFCGGINAMDTFCRNLGVTLEDDEKMRAFLGWREANQWALDFGDALMNAFISAFLDDKVTEVGRILMMPHPPQKGVAMVLPDGRKIVYPRVKLTGLGATFTKMDKAKPFDISVWRGLLSENATQGTAASLLRHVVTGLELKGLPMGANIVGTTHDEIILQNRRRGFSEEIAVDVSRAMVHNPPWLDGCPLNVEWSIGERYAMATHTGAVVGSKLN